MSIYAASDAVENCSEDTEKMDHAVGQGDPNHPHQQWNDNNIQCNVCGETCENVTEYTVHLNQHLQVADQLEDAMKGSEIKVEFPMQQDDNYKIKVDYCRST